MASPAGEVTAPREADAKPTETALVLDVLEVAARMADDKDAVRRTSGPESASGVAVGFGMSGKGPSTESVEAMMGKYESEVEYG